MVNNCKFYIVDTFQKKDLIINHEFIFVRNSVLTNKIIDYGLDYVERINLYRDESLKNEILSFMDNNDIVVAFSPYYFLCDRALDNEGHDVTESYWCRTDFYEILKKEKKEKREDIIQYANENGFMCAVIMSKEYAELYWTRLEIMKDLLEK